MTWHTMPGAKRTVYLPDWIRFFVKILPPTQKNQRPGIIMWGSPQWIQHETANYNTGADAEMHYRFLVNGANGTPLSYHFTNDDAEIYQMIPLNEVTWQAACGACAGNYDCWSNELCVNQGINEAKSRDIAEWLAAGVLEAHGIQPVKANITTHWDWNNVYAGGPNDPDRHHCPEQMLFIDKYWPTYEDRVIQKYAEIKALREGLVKPQPVPPKPPKYPKPETPDGFNTNAPLDHPADNMKYRKTTVYICRRNYRVVAKKGAGRLVTPDKGAESAGPRAKWNEKLYGHGLWVNPDTNVTYILDETGYWIQASSLTPNIKITPRKVDDDDE